MWIEVIGYAASALVAASLLLTSFVWLRMVNLAGAVCFVVYGWLIGALPIVLTNSFITLVNIYYLGRLLSADLSGFSYVPVDENRAGHFHEFVEEYRKDIAKFYPTFSWPLAEKAMSGDGGIYLALRNLGIEGFACFLPVSNLDRDDIPPAIHDYVQKELYPDRSLYISADYITRRYRGIGLVSRLYNRLLQELPSTFSFLVVVIASESRSTHRFLRRNGHIMQGRYDGYSLYVKTLR
ncbi:hypothetical protein [Salinispira pacifica]